MAMFAHCNVVELDTETSILVQGKVKVRDVGKPILPCVFEGISHYCLCDLGTAINVISYGFYLDIQEELEPATLENTDMTIMLADKTLRIPMGVVENATVTIGNNNFPIDFVVVDMPTDTLCPIMLAWEVSNYEDIVLADKEQEELESQMDSLPTPESPIDEAYEEPERRGDEELPPPELKV